MRTITITVSMLAGMMLLPVTGFAVTIIGSPGAGFQTWNAGDLDEDQKPYWDAPSLDIGHKNIGYALSGHPDVSLPNFPGAIPFWGQSYNSASDTGGGPDLNFSLNQTEGGFNASLRLEISAHSNTNEFGWYDVSSPSILHPIFGGSESAVTDHTFNPSANFGFYLKDGTAWGDTDYTQSQFNPLAEQQHQHFAIFKDTGNTSGHDVYWIGVEDLPLGTLGSGEGGYGDFNDMIIRIEAIPEPATPVLWLIGFALTCAAWRHARRLSNFR